MVVEQTLALIKPDAIHNADEIIDAIQDKGFTIVRKRRLRLSPEQVADFYAEHFGKEFFKSLVIFMSSGPIVALILAKADAISSWREALGPTSSTRAMEMSPESLRAKYGTDNTKNALHGSDSLISAMREIRFFFPEVSIGSPAEGTTSKEYLEEKVNPTLIRGLTALCKCKPEDPMRWLATWLEENNPNKPRVEEPQD